MRWAPVVAGVVAVGVGVLLLVSGEDPAREPEPLPTTSTTVPRESPALRWILLSGSGVEGPDRAVGEAALGFEVRSVYDLERQATVVRLRRTGPGRGAAQLIDDTRDVRDGERLTFSAWLRVTGTGRAWLVLDVYAPTLADRGRPVRPAATATSEERAVTAGRWQRVEVTLEAPPGTSLATVGIHFEGEGAVAVDDVVDP